MMLRKPLIIPFLFVIALLIGYIGYLFLVPVYVSREFDSIIYSFAKDYEEETKITIEGKLNRNLFSKNTFGGRVNVGNDLSYDFTSEYDGQKYISSIVEEDEVARIWLVGTIMISEEIDRIWLTLDDLNKRYDFDVNTFGPATNKEEANELINEMLSISE